MNGCGMQWYAYSPSSSNVYENVSPGAIEGELHTSVADVLV
jgi:hypothetical protein